MNVSKIQAPIKSKSTLGCNISVIPGPKFLGILPLYFVFKMCMNSSLLQISRVVIELGMLNQNLKQIS